jgi:hypothetical protein
MAHLLELLDLNHPTPPTTYTDVTVDPKTLLAKHCESHALASSDSEAVSAPSYIPPWVLSSTQIDNLRRQGQGVTPDLVYARGVPNVPNPDPSSFDKATCSLLLIEVGFGSDLNLKTKLEEKTSKYQPLMDELKKEWGNVHLVCVPIGHAGTLLAETAEHLAMALATRRPQAGRGQAPDDLSTDRHALPHDRKLANQLLNQLSDLAATRLLHILAKAGYQISINY